jgi:hypothetical protein
VELFERIVFVVGIALGAEALGCEQDNFINDHITGSIKVSNENDLADVQLGRFAIDNAAGLFDIGLVPVRLDDMEQMTLVCDLRYAENCNFEPIEIYPLEKQGLEIHYRLDLPDPPVDWEMFAFIAWLDRNHDGILSVDPEAFEEGFTINDSVEVNRLPEWESGQWVTAVRFQSGEWNVHYESDCSVCMNSGTGTNITHPDGWNFEF